MAGSNEVVDAAARASKTGSPRCMLEPELLVIGGVSCPCCC